MSANFSIKNIIRTDKILKNGNSPICLQIIINSEKKRISLGESVLLKDWDKKNGLAKGKGYSMLNAKLNKEKSDLEKFCHQTQLAGIPLSFNLIDTFLKGIDNNNFYSVFDGVLDMKKPNLSPDTLYKYETLRKRLKAFKSKLFTSDIDSAFLTRFDNYLQKLEIGTGGRYNHHKCLKCIINEAIEYKMFNGTNPYASKKAVKVKSPDHKEIFLEEEEVLRIKEYKNPSKTIRAVRDMFLLSCYTGLRYSDLFSLKLSDLDWKNKIISKTMLKTKHVIDVPLNNQIRGLLARYVIRKNPEDKIFPEIENQTGNRFKNYRQRM